MREAADRLRRENEELRGLVERLRREGAEKSEQLERLREVVGELRSRRAHRSNSGSVSWISGTTSWISGNAR